jgi:hypothetical protein
MTAVLSMMLAFILVVQAYRHKDSHRAAELIAESYARMSYEDFYPRGDIQYDLLRPLHNKAVLLLSGAMPVVVADCLLRFIVMSVMFLFLSECFSAQSLLFIFLSFMFSESYNIRNTKALIHGMLFMLFVYFTPISFTACFVIICVSALNMECSCLFAVYYFLCTGDYFRAAGMFIAVLSAGMIIKNHYLGTIKIRIPFQLYHGYLFRGMRAWRTCIVIGVIMLIPFIMGSIDMLSPICLTGMVFSVYAFCFPEACEPKNWLVPYISFVLAGL